MFQLLDSILHEFRACFKRNKTWKWFVVAVIGFMIRKDQRGVTSIISSLRLDPRHYHTLLHFFRSRGYKVTSLYDKWIKAATKQSEMERASGRIVLLGDHSKVVKEGRRMPGIQILHQESENSGKPAYIEGHNFGQVSAVITSGGVSRSLPLITELQKSPPRKEGTKKPDGDTLVTQMVNLIHRAAESLGEPVVAALDAYFSSGAAWAAADRCLSGTGERLVEIVTRAQSNTVAYNAPKPLAEKRRGQPRKYGDKIVLHSLFSDLSRFDQTSMVLYGKQSKVNYTCLDLIWMPVKRLVRFVIVKSDSGKCVLMSTSLSLSPEEIIAIYALRFKIETSFDEQKNDMGGFGYHFWTAALPKRKRWKKFGAEQPTDERLARRIVDAEQAIDSFVCLCTIATGILSIIAFSHSREIWKRYPGWIRTLRSLIPTTATAKETLAQDLPSVLRFCSHLSFCSIINSYNRNEDFLFVDVA
jgi:hypothetical protein